MGKLGCLAGLLLVVLIAIESVVYYYAAQMPRLWGGLPDYFVPILVMIATTVVGVILVRRTIAQISLAFMSGKAGVLVIRAVAGVLLALPGLASDVVGLILLIPGVAFLFGSLGNKIVASLMKHFLGKMMGGGAAGGFTFPGMPGGKPGAFPGLQPDQRFARKTGKTYDVKPDKD